MLAILPGFYGSFAGWLCLLARYIGYDGWLVMLSKMPLWLCRQ